MATFITNITFTQQGLDAVESTTKRASTVKAAGKKMGVKVREVYWTLGDHDGVLIFDAPDGETATAFLLSIAKQGNVRTTTSRAFSASEMDQILAKLGD